MIFLKPISSYGEGDAQTNTNMLDDFFLADFDS